MPTADELRKRLGVPSTAPQEPSSPLGGAGRVAKEELERQTKALSRWAGGPEGIKRFKQDILKKDPGFDYSGVPLLSFRTKFSFLDTPKERSRWLDQQVGKDNWTQDRYGAYALKPGGMEKLNLPHKGKPVTLEESGLGLGDIGDIAGDLPAVAGGVAAGTLTGGAGFIPGMLAVGAGVGGGKLLGETGEELAGMNIQPAGEVLKGAGKEALYGMAGEGVFRGALRPLGRKLMAPHAKRVTPQAMELLDEARRLKAIAKPTQVTKAPLLGRAVAVADRVLGDPVARRNSQALNAEMRRLQRLAGPKVGALEGGQKIVNDISRARKALSRWAGRVSARIDEEIGGEAVVPTQRLKQMAKDIVGDLPASADESGRALFTSPEMRRSLADIAELDDAVTVPQMQAITQRLWDAVSDDTILPGVSGRHARDLWQAATTSYDDIANPNIKGLIKPFRTQYAKEIKRFDNALVKRIMRDSKFAGSLPPERLVPTIFRKGMVRPIKQIEEVVTPGRFKEIQGEAMSDLLSKISRRTDDPLVNVFAGKQFLENLDSYGRDTLSAMFGKEITSDLYRLGNVTSLVTQRQAQAGGLVAANIALHPLQNVGRLVGLNVLSKFMTTDFAVKWLTQGIRAPKTRAGAAALTRAADYMALLVDQHTQGEAP